MRAGAGLHWPRAWDSEPIAFHLRKAAEPSFLLPTAPSISRALSGALETLGLSGDDKFDLASRETSFQAKIYKETLLRLRQVHFTKFFLIRLRRHSIPAPDHLQEIIEDLRKRKPEVRWAAMISWAGGWPTGARFQDRKILGEVPSCRCGCAAPDAWAHYAVCPRLQVVLSFAAPPRIDVGNGLWPPGAACADRERSLRGLAARLQIYRNLRLGSMVLRLLRRKASAFLRLQGWRRTNSKYRSVKHLAFVELLARDLLLRFG